ncbi:Cys-tRNA(Pro) deacylase [Desulfonema ishimotonii]|uniref:Cys-tRNA(Pro)/Cys-tRNA(Cys) deacylase n=1 Tax=Desulfonema ishimotonii TaxID=45657 RepID=A0A401FW90_9BACT|nr:aminoacyl-tRNA deacylase [Desulfonema ishimotonii]GBC61204.1 Cys-tRNA(Pro) deacylase [Desulfonema ishimotonii]
MKKSKGTRATAFLKRKGISFEIIQYDHQEKGAVFAASATGIPLPQTIKTLVTHLDGNRFALALMPGDRELSLKHLARAFSVKRAVMADTATAERLTGYRVGGISPFGVQKNLPVVMEERLVAYDFVVINAGQRGVMLRMNPKDIAEVLDCRLLSLVQE